MTEERFLRLRCLLSERIGSRRFSHTLGVEKAIIDLGERYLPGEIPRLRVAALLHDLTKEWSGAEQIRFCEENGIVLTGEERETPKILHARTGAYLSAKEFPQLVDPVILAAIERHTAGDKDMTVFDELLYLADYIEPTRTYPECIALREAFYRGYEDAEDKELHLHKIILTALISTVKEIEERGGVVFSKTREAISALSEKIAKHK